MSFYFRNCVFYSLLVGLISACTLGGCQSITDMDKPLAPSELMWRRPGQSIDDVKNALVRCSTKDDPAYRDATMGERLDARSICMLKKGFTFVPRPEGYPNICSYQTFKNSIACKSARGEYKVESDK